MKRVAMLSLFVVSIVLCYAAEKAAAEEKWADLFDGKTLNGWVVRSGFAKYFVEDGAIVGETVEGSPNTFLCTEKNYGDFILEFEVKDDPALNSGVQIRSHTYDSEQKKMVENKGKKVERKFPAGRVYGYQVEISNEQAGTSGGIYDEARRGWLKNIHDDPAASKAFKDNQWNKYRVICRGDSIKTFVNGVPCADLVDSADRSGFIGLQVHQIKANPPLHVRWRNIHIQQLDQPAAEEKK
jgi:hypothetical protein